MKERERERFSKEALEKGNQESERELGRERERSKSETEKNPSRSIAALLFSCSLLLLASRFFLKHDERRCLHLFVLSLFSPAGLSCAYGSVQARRCLLRLRERGVHRLQEEGQGPRGVPGGGRRRDLLRRRAVSLWSAFGSLICTLYDIALAWTHHAGSERRRKELQARARRRLLCGEDLMRTDDVISLLSRPLFKKNKPQPENVRRKGPRGDGQVCRLS